MQKQAKTSSFQGGMMGIVSGMKGGAPAGALMGIVIMAVTTADAQIRSLWFYAIVVGLTLGLMGGATFGAFYGFVAGYIGTRPLNQQRSAMAIWHGLSLLIFTPLVWLMLQANPLLALTIGILCGLLMGHLAHREFLKVWHLQNSPES